MILIKPFIIDHHLNATHTHTHIQNISISLYILKYMYRKPNLKTVKLFSYFLLSISPF